MTSHEAPGLPGSSDSLSRAVGAMAGRGLRPVIDLLLADVGGLRAWLYSQPEGLTLRTKAARLTAVTGVGVTADMVRRWQLELLVGTDADDAA